MVELETVLVLGAGASWDYGFPTGEELVGQICNMFRNRQGQEYKLLDRLSSLGIPHTTDMFLFALEKAKPLSVDAWLEHNTKFIRTGKFAIAIALLEYEAKTALRPEATGDWYQLLYHRLDSPFEEFHNNKLSIITFNYDRLAEYYLFEVFRNMHTEKSEKECIEKIKQLRILHVYGSLGCLEWQDVDSESPEQQVRYGTQDIYGASDIETIISAANNIKIIPEKSNQLPKEFQESRKLIENAQALYFLGFGYSKDNIERLGIKTLRMPQKIMGTAKGLGYQEYQELRRMSIFNIPIEDNLLDDKTVYEFLHDCVDLNSLD